MKLETKIDDITKALEGEKAINRANNAATSWKAHASDMAAAPLGLCINPSILGKAQIEWANKIKAEVSFAKIPASRRSMAEQTIKMAKDIGRDAAKLGSDYSGDTTYSACFWEHAAEADTSTDRGEQYSRRCTYHKTNAGHHVRLNVAGAVALVENEALRSASIRDGLHLISLMEDGAAVWVKASGKQIISESGWCLGNGAVCYHSTKSLEDCQKGLARKVAIATKQAAERAERDRIAGLSAAEKAKLDRRARLVARLCSHVTATIADARSMGYCTPGIEAFQSAHGIGNKASLPELVRTGNAAAVALALHIARKVAGKVAVTA